MKKIFGFILSVIMCVTGLGVLAGCGDSKYVSVEFWHYYTGAQGRNLAKYIETFNNTVGVKKKIIINEVAKGSLSSLQSALEESAADGVGAEAMPDMFMAYSDTALSINKLKPLANIDDYFSSAELSQYVEGYLSEGRIDGDKIKVFPVAKATEILTVNATYFEKFMTEYNAAHPGSVSWADFSTIEGITALGEKYYNFTGKALYARDATDNYFFSGAKQQGKDLFEVQNSNVNTLFHSTDKSVVKNLWDNYYAPYVKGWFSHKGKYGTDCLYNYETIAALGSTSSAYYIKEKMSVDGAEEDIDIRILPSPIFKDGAKVYTQQGAGICVSKTDSKTEKACVEFIKWFTEEDRNIEFAGVTGYLPVKKHANDIDKIKSALPSDTAEVFIDVLDVSVQMINDCQQMYTCLPFEGGASARNIFKYDFSDLCGSDFNTVADLIKQAEKLQGAAKQEALAEAERVRANFLSEEYFNDWCEGVKNKLDAILEQS